MAQAALQACWARPPRHLQRMRARRHQTALVDSVLNGRGHRCGLFGHCSCRSDGIRLPPPASSIWQRWTCEGRECSGVCQPGVSRRCVHHRLYCMRGRGLYLFSDTCAL